MASWGIAELKTKASEVVESAQSKGPQEITRHGKRVALIVSPRSGRSGTARPRTMPEPCQSFSRVRRWWIPTSSRTSRSCLPILAWMRGCSVPTTARCTSTRSLTPSDRIPERQGRSRRRDTSWEVREHLFDVLAGKDRRIRGNGQYGKAGNGIGDDAGGPALLCAGGQHNPPAFDGNIDRVARVNIEATAELRGKHDLTFGGDAGLDGKTILPQGWMALADPTHPAGIGIGGVLSGYRNAAQMLAV